MKPIATQVIAHVGTADEEIEMGIDVNSMAHIMSILTDLYPLPIVAVEREYSTNALDSNIEAGNPDPIEVTLPTVLNPNFVVKDQGVGLNVDDIKRIYSKYGASTKRDSDAVTGMLGLGSKSGLTYALQFTVDAVKHGVRTVAIVTKNEEGVGTIQIIDTAGTDEPNGVTISIPVKARDVREFQIAADELYKFWEPGTVLVGGKEPELERNRSGGNVLWLDPDIKVTKSDNRAGRNQNTSRVVMGGVAYPFTPTFPHEVIAWLPIGSVQFTPARDQLQMTPFTEGTLNDLNRFIEERFPAVLRDRIKNAPTPWDRAAAFHAWTTQMSLQQKKDVRADAEVGKIQMPVGRSGFLYSVSEDRASKQEVMFLADMLNEDQIILTGYPNKTLIKEARIRLEQLVNAARETDPNITQTVKILPEAMNTDVLQGRRNVHTWEGLQATTTGPAAVKRIKSDVIYESYQNGVGSQTVGQFTKDPNVPLLYVTLANLPVKRPESRRRHYSSNGTTTFSTVPELSKKHPEVVIVSIGEHQVAKFLRLHPWAESAKEYLERLTERLLGALTDTDRLSRHLAGSASRLARDLHAAKTTPSDRDLRKLAKLHGHTSPALVECSKYGIPIPAPTTSALWNTIAKRYPLLASIYYGSSVNVDDLMVYLEAKFLLTSTTS